MATTSSVLADVVGSLQRLLAAGTIRLLAETKPVPAPRPRVMKWGGVFYPKPYTEFTATLQQEFAKQRDQAPLDEPLMAAVVVTSERPKSTKLHHPRGDCDNHAKGPLDAITKTARVWLDDSQIGTLLIHKRWGLPGEPGSVAVHVTPMGVPA